MMKKARRTMVHAPMPKRPAKRMNPMKTHMKGVGGAKSSKGVHGMLPSKPSKSKSRGEPPMKSNKSPSLSDEAALKKWMY
jgi:hypothetical protein